MDHFPPPQIPPPGPMVEPQRSRLMVGGVAAVTAVLVAGGLIVGSQLVSADRPSIATTSAVAAQEDIPAEGDTPAENDTPDEDLSDEGDTPDFDIGDLVPADVKAEFEAFEQCLDERLGGAFGELDGEIWNGSVVVENLGGDGEDALSVYDFGAGDATVTVTKTGDNISVTTSGDVSALDESFFDAEMAEWEAAEEACADLLPDDVTVFDMEFGELGNHLDGLFDEFPIEEMLEEFPIEEMLEEFPIEEMLEEGTFGNFEMMFDEGTLDDLKEMFETGELGDVGTLLEDLGATPAGSASTD